MKRPIKDIMEREVYTCRFDQTLEEVVKLFAERGTSGLTVVDDEGRVVGFISDGDIMKVVSEQKTRAIFNGGFSSMLVYDADSFEDKARALRTRKVMELATTRVLCATPDQTIGAIAEVLSKKRYKKVPVVNESGLLVGVVRRATITRYIFQILFGEGKGEGKGEEG